MIDVARTEPEMLAEIGSAGEVQIVMHGRTPDDLLPILMDTFSKRYAALPSKRVYDELSYPVKKGLGNAYKWGNEGAAERTLTVRAVMTDAGAVVAITDQGNGFDVPAVLERFLRRDGHFRHGGSGFDHFHQTPSVVSYADGGRTILIRFLSAPAVGQKAASGTPREPKQVRRVEFERLAAGCQVKVKGALGDDGRFVAEKVTLKPPESCAVVDGLIRGLVHRDRRVRVLSLSVPLGEDVEIVSPEQRRLDFTALSPGQAVELTGSYSLEAGFVPVKVQVRQESDVEVEEVQGVIDAISRTDATFDVLGMTIATSADTEIKDKRPVLGSP